MCIGDTQHMIRTLEVGWDIILIAEVIMVIMHEVIWGMQETIVIEGMIIGINIMIEIGVGHLKDRIDVGEMTEVWVTVGQDQVLEQVQIEIELGVLNVGNMTILWGNVQQDKKIERQSRYNKMFNMDEDQTILQTSLMDTEEDEMIITLIETRNNLNL